MKIRYLEEKDSDLIFGGPGIDTISGGPEPDIFDCGLAEDSVIDFNELEGDFARNNCEMSGPLPANMTSNATEA